MGYDFWGNSLEPCHVSGAFMFEHVLFLTMILGLLSVGKKISLLLCLI